MGKRFPQKNVFCSAKKQQKSLNSWANVKYPFTKMAHAIHGGVVGTCRTMCPQSEITLREREILIHPFEVLKGTELCRYPSGDPQKMVKMYSRPAAGRVNPLTSDLRPPDVLLNTVQYLLNRVAPRDDCRWTEVYEFVSDRLRAVRQDLIVQSISGRPTIQILENTVIFHIYAGYRLCMEPVAAFVPTLNNNHIQESLKWLLSQYRESDSYHDNRVLFESIYLLYNLGNTDALRHCLQLDERIRSTALLQTAYRISVSHMLGDYVRAMRLIQGLSSVHCQMAVHRHFVEFKRSALRTMSAGYSSKNLRFPVSKLTELLPLDSEHEAVALCRSCGLSVVDRKVQFIRTSFKSDSEIKPSHVEFIDRKLKSIPVAELFFKHPSDNIKEPTQPAVPTKVQMSLPLKFSRLKLNSEGD